MMDCEINSPDNGNNGVDGLNSSGKFCLKEKM